MKTLLIVTSCFVLMTGCSPYLSADGGKCPCKEGWKCCNEICVREGSSCTTDGGYDGCSGAECHDEMATARFGHASVVLDDGRLLITGGITRDESGMEEILATVEIFDPITRMSRIVLRDNNEPETMLAHRGRAFHTATLLGDGKVLLAGGIGIVEGKKTSLQSAEIFDPIEENFGIASVMGTKRAHHTAPSLPNGEVLITGGASYSHGEILAFSDTAVLYQPSTNSFVEELGSSMTTARAFHSALLMNPMTANIRVLVVGGENEQGPLDSIEIYNPMLREFAESTDVIMSRPRSHHCAVLLDDNVVMVAGGTSDISASSVDATVEIYLAHGGPIGDFVEQNISMHAARMDHTCTKLGSGNVLVAGGFGQEGLATDVGELFVAEQGTYWSRRLAEPLVQPRAMHTATVLASGWGRLAGGLPNTDPQSSPILESQYFLPDESEAFGCPCKNPLDSIRGHEEKYCVREGYTCNALNPCEENYECGEVCHCANPSICGIDCSSGCACPGEFVCDEGTGTCRKPKACLDSEMCTGNQVCREAEFNPDGMTMDYYRCLSQRGAEVGQWCESDHQSWECKSTICYTNVCLQSCNKNAECPSGQYCALVDHEMLGCVVQSECGSTCSEPEYYCDFDDQTCRNDLCRTGADCENDCKRDGLHYSRIGRCTLDGQYCSDNEFLLKTGIGEICLIYQSCWTDLDCAEPYRCFPESWGGGGHGNYCGREANP